MRGTQLVQEACRRHETSPTAGAALGRALLGTLLMAAFREEGEKTQVRCLGGEENVCVCGGGGGAGGEGRGGGERGDGGRVPRWIARTVAASAWVVCPHHVH